MNDFEFKQALRGNHEHEIKADTFKRPDIVKETVSISSLINQVNDDGCLYFRTIDIDKDFKKQDIFDRDNIKKYRKAVEALGDVKIIDLADRFRDYVDGSTCYQKELVLSDKSALPCTIYVDGFKRGKISATAYRTADRYLSTDIPVIQIELEPSPVWSLIIIKESELVKAITHILTHLPNNKQDYL